MKVGDLIKVSPTACDGTTDNGLDCGCWFCYYDSNKMGIILKCLKGASRFTTIPPSDGYWSVMFDVGEWRLYGTEMEIISESW